jgi:cell shape-determining protein MreC
MTSIAINLDTNLRKKLILSLFGGAILFAFLYGYFINQTILNVVARKNIEADLIELGSEVSSLEVEYIKLKNKIDLEFAHSLGYKDVSDIKFVSRKSLGKTLTIND